MAKTSIDYSEIAGLSTALSRLHCKQPKSTEENIVEAWLSNRIAELRSK